MHLKRKTLQFLLVCLTIFSVSSCQTGIKFDPDWHRASSAEMAIVNEEGLRVYADSIEFDSFACMHEDKIKELAEILLVARIPKKQKTAILEKLNKALEWKTY